MTLSAVVPIQATTPRTSGVYLTASDYQDGRLAFEADCKSKAHGLELHDINKPYIDVTHESERRRYSKHDLFGFRACYGGDNRFSAKLSRYLAIMSKTEQFVASAGAMLLYAPSTNVHLVSPKCDGSESFASVTLSTVHSSPTR